MVEIFINLISHLVWILFHIILLMLLWVHVLFNFKIKNVLKSMMQLVSPRFRIKMGTIHQNLHVSYLLNDIHHVEVTLNPLFKMVIEPVGFCKILAATIAAHKPQEPHAAVVKPFA